MDLVKNNNTYIKYSILLRGIPKYIAPKVGIFPKAGLTLALKSVLLESATENDFKAVIHAELKLILIFDGLSIKNTYYKYSTLLRVYIAPKVGIFPEAGSRGKYSLPRVRYILYSTRKGGIFVLLASE